MGREISYICDACGRDCTNHYYILSVVRKEEGSYRFNVDFENAEWTVEEDDGF